jgi:CarboxypepD_reg-like domain
LYIAAMFKMPAVLFTLLIISFNGFSQRTIRGRVVNASGGEPIPGSSVFINNSSKGMVSDRQGEFELNDIPVGKHDLIVSSIGYETNVFSFDAAQLPLQLKMEMRVKVRELENVTVEPSVEEGWDKWGRLFTDNFVGHIPNGLHCKIKNQKAIRFRYYKKSNRVIAYADEPVILENKALGYKISYQLEDFEVNFRSGATSFAGYPFFEEMEKDKKKWQRNRERAYQGSMVHFMRSLYQDDLASEGFEVRRMSRIPNTEKERVKKIYLAGINNRTVKLTGNSISVSRDSLNKDSVDYYERIMQQKEYTEIYSPALLTADSLVVQMDGNYKVIFFTDYLYITFKKETEDKEYLFFHHESRRPTFQRSYIWLTNLNPIAIDANGSYYPPQEIFSMAYWGWEEKMANMLPLDYEPAQ